MVSETEIELYTAGTPNGHKVNILMEELGLNYKVIHVDISKNQQKEDWFLKINPNGRIPAIVDKTNGTSKRIFEGASILLYLCAKYDPGGKMSFKYDSDEYWEVVEWLVWMQSGIGPMQGQSNHFYRYAPEKIPYAINRYQTETKRLYQVLDDRLAAQEAANQGLWMVGGKYTIADLACFSWVNWASWAGVDTRPYPQIEKWVRTIEERPATATGVNFPEEFKLKKFSKEEQDDYAKKSSNWIMQNQDADQQKHT